MLRSHVKNIFYRKFDVLFSRNQVTLYRYSWDYIDV